jgi:hypothetical protein
MATIQQLDFKEFFKRDIRRNMNKPAKEELFQSLFGSPSDVCNPVYNFIRCNIASGEVDSMYNSFEPVHLLWGLHHMKSYGTHRNQAVFMNTSVNTHVKWTQFVVQQIALMHERVVRSC